MANVATISATAMVDTKKWTAGTKKMQKDIQRVQRAVSDFARRAAIGFAAGAAALTGVAIKMASDMEETLSKFNVVFGENADSAREWSTSFADSIGRSHQQILSFMASSQDLFVPLGFAAQQAEQMSQQITQLAVDLGSFNNMADDAVLRDLQAALTGSGEVMKKYGVLVSEAAVKQELLNQGLDPRSATDQQKVMARLNIIMAGTAAAQGDAARTAGSFANQLKALKADAANLAVEFGQMLLPLATKFVETLRALLAATKVVAAGFGTWQGKMALLVTGTMALILIVPKIIAAFRTLAAAIKSAAIAKAILLSLSGPKGWAILAGSAVAAGLAIWGITEAFNEQNDQLKLAERQAQETANSMGALNDEIEELAAPENSLEQAKTDWWYLERLAAGSREQMEGVADAQDRINQAQLRQVGAVTRGTVAGFSAVVEAQSQANAMRAADQNRRQEAQRAEAQRAEMVNHLRRYELIPLREVNL